MVFQKMVSHSKNAKNGFLNNGFPKNGFSFKKCKKWFSK